MTQTAVEMRQQKQVKVYDINLMRQGVIDVYRSLIWTRKYHEAGSVELHAALNSKNLKLLQKGNIVAMTGSMMVTKLHAIPQTPLEFIIIKQVVRQTRIQ